MTHQSLLWSLVRPEGQISWLFGTMHIRDDRAYQLCEELYPLIMAADQFIGEMDLDMKMPDTPMMLQYDIHQFVSPKEYEKLRHQLNKSFGVNLDQLSKLHPLMIMSFISTSVLQAEHHISLDEHLWQFAKDNGKPVSGLESYDEQFNILHSIDPQSLYKQLLDICRNPSAIRKSTDKSLELYINGKIHQLYKLSKASMQHLRKKVIYDRNRHMASVIDHLHMSTQYFITVGAGHLSGKYGLIRLLKKSGWQLKPARIYSTLKE